MKALVAKEIQKGDVVRIRERCTLTVKEVELRDTFAYEYHPKVHIAESDGYAMEVDADSIVGLIHRPRPEGKTEDQLLNDVLVALIGTGADCHRDHLRAQLPGLLRAIEAYELSRLPEE